MDGRNRVRIAELMNAWTTLVAQDGGYRRGVYLFPHEIREAKYYLVSILQYPYMMHMVILIFF